MSATQPTSRAAPAGQVMYSPRLTGARGLSHGHIFTRDGWLAPLAAEQGERDVWNERRSSELGSLGDMDRLGMKGLEGPRTGAPSPPSRGVVSVHSRGNRKAVGETCQSPGDYPGLLGRCGARTLQESNVR